MDSLFSKYYLNDHQKKKTEVQHYFFSKNEDHIVCIVSGLHVS
jgi:hypothetical protein